MASKSNSIAAKAEALALPFAKELGLDLWDVRFVKEGADWFLRFFIDKEGGVNIDDCELVSRALEAKLDEKDPIELIKWKHLYEHLETSLDSCENVANMLLEKGFDFVTRFG